MALNDEKKSTKTLIGPWLGSKKEKESYARTLQKLENAIKNNSHLQKNFHYSFKNMEYGSNGREVGKWVMVLTKNVTNGPSWEQNKLVFEAKMSEICKVEKSSKKDKEDNILFVEIVNFMDEIKKESPSNAPTNLNNSAPSRALSATNDDEMDDRSTVNAHYVLELKEIFYLLCIPAVANRDQPAISADWLMCNLPNETETTRAFDLLKAMGITVAIRADKKCNLSIWLEEKISKGLKVIKNKPALLPKIYLGKDAFIFSTWLIRKFYRDVTLTTSEEIREIGVLSKWLVVPDRVAGIVETLRHHGVIALSCDTSSTTSFTILLKPRAIYEFYKSGGTIKYVNLCSKLNSLLDVGKIDELPEDFSTVVPFEFRNNTQTVSAKVDVPRKKYRYHDEVYSLILTKLGIPAYNQHSPLVKSMKISNGEAPNKEGKDYYKILILRDEDDSSTKQDIINILDPAGYDCHYVGEKEGKKLSKKTICFYPKKEIALQNPEPAKVVEKPTEEIEVKQYAEPKLIPNLVDSFSLIIEAILSQLTLDEIKMLVSKITALTPEIPEPVVVDKTAESIDKLMLVYKFVPSQISDAFNASYFANKDQVLKLLLSEDK